MSSMLLSLLLILLSNFVVINNCANILALFPWITKSHAIVGYELCENLVRRGHNVTHVSAFPRGTKLVNYHEVNLTEMVNPFPADLRKSGILKIFEGNVAAMAAIRIPENLDAVCKLTETVLKDKNLQKILKGNEKFDVIIMGALAQEALLGIGYHFKAPIIITMPPGMNLYVDDWVGNPAPYSYVPTLNLDHSDRMTFSHRLTNTLYGTYVRIYQHMIHYPEQNRILKKYFPNAPDIFEMMKSIAIVLSNSHESIAYPRPLVPNVIQVGGLHVAKPKQLPADIQKFMDDAPHGVIYFSLGSSVRGRHVLGAFTDSFINVFSKLKQKVLWKWDVPLQGLPENVRVSKWYPQSDILAHSNMKLFITHGGRLSTTETVVRGVPLIGIPLFADQFLNMKIATDMGFCIVLDSTNITEESFTAAINEILYNTTYYENVKKRSAMYNDQIVHPLDKAVYWVEYVIRHKGALHFRSAGADIPLYQYLLLDVIGFVLFVMFVVFGVLYFILKQLIVRILTYFTKSVPNKKDKNKKEK